MAKTMYELKSLHKIEKLEEAFRAELAAAVADCRARPAINKPRKVVIELQIKPDKSDFDDVIIDHRVRGKVPELLIDPYKMQATQRGLQFQPDSPMNPDQNSLDFGDDD